MARAKPTELAELFRPADATWASRRVAAGDLRRVARGLYTPNLDEPLDQLVRRRWLEAATLMTPGAVLVDRSAVTAAPEADGTLFVDTGSGSRQPRPVTLPGLLIVPRSGPGPLPGDMPLGAGLWRASDARAALDNLRPSRARKTVSRTLSRTELDAWLDRLARLAGTDYLNRLRDEARALTPALGADEDFATLDRLIGRFLGTRVDRAAGAAARARGAGLPVDPDRVALFDTLRAALSSEPTRGRTEPADPQRLAAFLEAYLSNWIEGTEFELEEARAIVLEGRPAPDRPADAHDITGTFDAILDSRLRAAAPLDADDLEDYLRSAHEHVMGGRPEQRPGHYKQHVNRAGATRFVHPDDVRGTLRAGAELLPSLAPGFPRAVFAMFLSSEVHPFGDGNGRVSRLLMNSHLSAAGEARILVPLVFRNEYLTALRALSLGGRTAPLIRALDVAQQWSSAMPWSSLAEVTAALEATNALVRPEEAEPGARFLMDPESGRRLRPA